ncbi:MULTISPECIES: Tc toxin subunit A [unclassified Pseudomonas]|uniref:Tc toxin subunit A n=1 Tax=unclassified Pseudomonas TaxID=196821 RepID=UPI0008718FB0|nr:MULTISPECIES: Tc toxin subunit A [unclassified Pseudomonas]SCW80275.1 virulence plasmid A protein [Pseudomonas sp. NFACC56-3]SFK37630.1 virulence plasmid A protein [Pseudomonas sp. NFACC52]
MSESNPLLSYLVDATEAPADGTKEEKVDFVTAMERLDIQSVFDIVRQPKGLFCQRLAKFSDADGELAYDNALCYAVQIARLYREKQVTSDRARPASKRTGIRALVDIGPSYPNLFKERWDEFCKVGALAAVDSPVAYLSALYRLATTSLEEENTGDASKKIRLDVRRPDIKTLLIDQQATFKPLPMLDIANTVLSQGIERYLSGTSSAGTPLHRLFAAKYYPFSFPYTHAHHQCKLGLSQKKLMLGEINYLISPQLPVTGGNNYGRGQQHPTVAQQLFAGLSVEQYGVLTRSTPFSTYYISHSQLVEGWQGPSISNLNLFEDRSTSYLLPQQEMIKRAEPEAHEIATSGGSMSTQVTLAFSKSGGADKDIVLSFGVRRVTENVNYAINRYSPARARPACTHIQYLPADNAGASLQVSPGYQVTFDMLVATLGTDSSTQLLEKQRFTLALDEAYVLTGPEQAFFRNYYGMEVMTQNTASLSNLNTFMAKTELNAEQVEALLSQRSQRPRLSVNCPSLNLLANGGQFNLPYPHASHYGACYVNGVGSDRLNTSAETPDLDRVDNSMGLNETIEDGRSEWSITKTSLNRFDRLQRMIRLQRWMNIPFAELDTLVVSAIRGCGENNLEVALNGDVMRVLGLFRYFSSHYQITAEEFAAFFHHLSPYATGARTPLFDQVFNSPSLFDTPFVLDQQAFDLASADLADQKTAYQLCAGLGVQLTEGSLLQLANITIAHVGPLTRSLETVSSLYRQARIARMFDLSIEDYCALLDLLGGEAYQKNLATGRFRLGGGAPDIADILMHMDWAVTWLRDTKRKVGDVRRLLGRDPYEFLPLQTLLERLNRLAAELTPALVSPSELDRLSLPEKDDNNADIAWRTLLNAELLNDQGLVMSTYPRTLDETTAQVIDRTLAQVLQPLHLSNEVKASVQTQLGDCLVSGYLRQLQLLESLLQETLSLPMALAEGVIQWSSDSTHGLLSQVLAMPSQSLNASLIERFQILLRHAAVARHLGISARALRAFLCEPTWLGLPNNVSHLTLASLYYLERYCYLLDMLDKAEAEWLGYLALANPPEDLTKTDAHLAVTNQSAHSALAQLLGWQPGEVKTLCDTLPDGRATQWLQVEWVYRCQQVCQTTGLGAASVLLCAGVSAYSNSTSWLPLGEALMAASR